MALSNSKQNWYKKDELKSTEESKFNFAVNWRCRSRWFPLAYDLFDPTIDSCDRVTTTKQKQQLDQENDETHALSKKMEELETITGIARIKIVKMKGDSVETAIATTHTQQQ